jgi:hypothetical protein
MTTPAVAAFSIPQGWPIAMTNALVLRPENFLQV